MSADPAGTSDLAAGTVRAITDAVVTLDTKGVITSWNPSAESLLGHPASEMVGATLATLDTASIGAPALAAVRDGGKYVTVTKRGIDVFRSGGRMDSEALTTLAGMASTGHLHTPVAKVFALDDARVAYEAFAQRTGRGRIVLSFR